MLFLLMALANADDSTAHQEIGVQLNEGRVLSAIEDDPSESIDHFQALLTDLPESADVYFELHYWMGRAYAKSHNYVLARKSLHISKRHKRYATKSTDFLRLMNRWQNRVRNVPYSGYPWVNESGENTRESSAGFSVAFDVFEHQPNQLQFTLSSMNRLLRLPHFKIGMDKPMFIEMRLKRANVMSRFL